MAKEALVIVDPQRDFCPGGKLAVKDGDQVVDPANNLSAEFRQRQKPVVITRDWHQPDNTAHMGPGRWPEHCLQESPGAQFHPRLNLDGSTTVSKGMANTDNGYSGFEGITHQGQPLHEFLQRRGVDSLVVCGLATDYCVNATVLDARKLGYNVTVAADAIRAVNLQPGDGDKAIEKMKQAGAVFSDSETIIRSIK